MGGFFASTALEVPVATAAQVAHQKKAFLAAFGEHGNVTTAAKAADVPRRTVYSWLERDDKFATEYRFAEVEATETLEAEARRRAYEGVSKPVFYKGTECGYVQEYSDTLLIFLLKARAPEKYRDRHDVTSGGEVVGSGVVPGVLPSYVVGED